MHKKWADTYAKCVCQEADIYASTTCMGACHSIVCNKHFQNFMPSVNFRITIGTNNQYYVTNDEENSVLIKLSQGVIEAASSAVPSNVSK